MPSLQSARLVCPNEIADVDGNTAEHHARPCRLKGSQNQEPMTKTTRSAGVAVPIKVLQSSRRRSTGQPCPAETPDIQDPTGTSIPSRYPVNGTRVDATPFALVSSFS